MVAQVVVGVAQCHAGDGAVEEFVVVRPGGGAGEVPDRLGDVGVVAVFAVGCAEGRHRADVSDAVPPLVRAIEPAQDQDAAFSYVGERPAGGVRIPALSIRSSAVASHAITSHWSLPCGNFAIASAPSSSRTDAFGRAPPRPVVPVSRSCLIACAGSSSETILSAACSNSGSDTS